MPRLYGFDDQSRRRLRDDEVEPTRQMVSRALAGASNADIAAWANQEGHRGTLGGEWKDASIGRLLRNPAIAGLRREKDGSLVDAGHPGAITASEFHALEEREKARKTATPDDAHDYLLNDEASTCGKCTQALQGARTNAGTPGYRCRPKDKNGRGGCGEVRIDAELLDTHVGEYVVAELLKPGIYEQILRAQELVKEQVEKFKADLVDLEGRRKEAAMLYGQRQISSEAFVIADGELTKNLKETRKRLRYAEQMANFKLGGVTDLVRWWNTAPTASRRAIVLLFLEAIVVYPARARGVRTIEPGRVVLRWRKMGSASGS
ncbi:recombinase family protein [Streptomyces sp. NPDC093111]|uniref:recombinase family protein n=1 Tax=Streptomyces sp. NPDC093111 TaxID=3154978 RepID=UPI00343B6A23